ncbi:hypothetical protein P8452_05548 [Trifolium repens]|nr:hypothetical protein P8452_05548 [Trifolium repens]
MNTMRNLIDKRCKSNFSLFRSESLLTTVRYGIPADISHMTQYGKQVAGQATRCLQRRVVSNEVILLEYSCCCEVPMIRWHTTLSIIDKYGTAIT